MPKRFRLIPALLLAGLLMLTGCSSQTDTSQIVNGCQIKPQTICQGVDLSYADLSGANLGGAKLSGANLSGANLSGANLGLADLTDAFLSGANLSGANLGGADLTLAIFFGANLAGANLGDTLVREVQILDANVSGAHLGRHFYSMQRNNQLERPLSCLLDNLNVCLIDLDRTLKSIEGRLKDIWLDMP